MTRAALFAGRVSGQTFWSMAIILLLGFSLRVYKLDTYSIFLDEVSTMLVSQGIVLEGANQKEVFSKPTFTPQDFWKTKSLADYYEAMTRSDIGNSPLYYALLHFWMDVFGISDFSSRFFSVLFSMVVIYVTFLFGRKFFSEKTGLGAALVVAIEPFFIAYAHQARNYSLTFSLTLLSCYFFLSIAEEERSGKAPLRTYVKYIVVSLLCPLSHFLTVSVFLAQGLYALFFLRVKKWPKLLLAGALAMTGIAWWLTLGGGLWTLGSLNYQAELYRRMALEAPFDNPFGNILPATIPNVSIKSIPIFSDLFLFTNGLADALAGKKNVLFSLAVGILLVVGYRLRRYKNEPEWLKLLGPGAILLLTSFLYNNHKLQFVILSASIFSLSFLYEVFREDDATGRRRQIFLYLMALVPTLFLILMTFKNGHTNGLTQRYSGFSFPFVAILTVLLIFRLWRLPLGYRAPVMFLLGCQLFFVGLRLGEFYRDRSAKYSYFVTPRKPNPYYALAKRIPEAYQPGDTIFYPARKMVITNPMDLTFLPYSIVDAQMTNLYLPKEATYTQAVDTSQTTKVILKKRDGSRTVLSDLQGLRYGFPEKE